MDELFNENPANTPDETDIRDILKDVIERVENMSCSVSIDADSSPAADTSRISGVSRHSNDRSKNSTPKSEISKHRSGSKKNRVRYRKHKWKPYHKLSATERTRLEERISRKAYRSREKMSLSGLALAPYNTTQFLINDQDFRLSDRDMHSPERRLSDSVHSDCNSSPDDGDVFIQRQFSEAYNSFHEDYIKDLPKVDLIRESIRLEDDIEEMERALKAIADVEMKIEVFQVEIEKLLDENHELEQKNEELQRQLSLINVVM